MKKIYLLLLCGLMLPIYASKQQPFDDMHDLNARTLVQHLSLDEKIGQLFMVAAVSDETLNEEFMARKSYKLDEAYIQHLITHYHIGGIIFLGKGTLQTQYDRTQQYQKLSSIPLLIGLDAEWGLSMRLDDAIRFPHNMTLGALQNESLIYSMGADIAQQARLLGIHIIFAPVIDVNNNPLNPIINDRSFGQDKHSVARRGAAFMHALQDNGIIGCAKHFPGHGDTNIDSHYDLPRIDHDLERIKSLELFPFTALIDEGVQAVMTAHLEVPALEKEQHLPTSLSYNTITNVLKNACGFKGLIITDGLDMQGVNKYCVPGIIELKALQAGNDILLCPIDVPKAHECIKQAVLSGIIAESTLDNHVYTILLAKQWAFAHAIPEIFSPELLHTKQSYDLKKQLYQEAITLARNDQALIPLTAATRNNTKVHCVQFGGTPSNTFLSQLQKTFEIEQHHSSSQPSLAGIDQLIQTLDNENANIIIVSLFNMNKYKRLQFGIANETQQCIKQLHEHGKQIILVIFGSPYSMSLFDSIPTIIFAYEDDPCAQCAAADAIIGTITAHGSLPVTTESDPRTEA